jgi:CRP-like cAMP-binding protein
MEDIPASTGAEAGEEQTLPSSVVETPDPSAWKLSFMDRLSEADRQVLVARGQRRFFPAGTLICQEGDAGDALYVVEQGEVAVLKEMSDGRSTLLGYRGRGESLGEMSLVGQQPRFASVVAEEDTELLCIPAAEFPALMSYPGISWAILNVLNDRLHNADLARTSILQAEQRLARRVRRLATEAERQTQLARVREEALELIAHDLRTPLTVIDGWLKVPHLPSSISWDWPPAVWGSCRPSWMPCWRQLARKSRGCW